MLGTILILNSKNHTGKIVFANGDETSILNFPNTFETGDSADVSFFNDDINQKINRLIAYTSVYYGFVMKKFSPINGNILVTYPQPKGLINFQNRKLNISEHEKVTFKIKKTIDGKLEAVDIAVAENKDDYKCQLPRFGKLEEKIIRTKESFVKEIKKFNNDDSVAGKIKILKEDRGFGFITLENGEDVYFPINLYKKFYKMNPSKGLQVNCKIRTTSQGLQVVQFTNGTEILSTDQQYIMIENQRVSMENFLKIYKREPQLGDIVYFFKNNGTIELMPNHQTKSNLVFVQQESQKKKEEIQSGKIITLQEHFGFIKGDPENIYFNSSLYEKTFKRQPQKGEIVHFSVKKTSKRLQVETFSKALENVIYASLGPCRNFAFIDHEALYYAYIHNNQAKEIYLYDANKLSESISCYKDFNMPKKFKLEAIDTLIEHNYHDTKISSEQLKVERSKILNRFVEANIEKNNYILALEFEYRLQQLNYNSVRIKRLSNINQKQSVEMRWQKENIKLHHDESLSNISLEKTIVPLQNDESFDIDLNKKIVVQEYKFTQEYWNIDLNSQNIVIQSYRPKEPKTAIDIN